MGVGQRPCGRVTCGRSQCYREERYQGAECQGGEGPRAERLCPRIESGVPRLAWRVGEGRCMGVDAVIVTMRSDTRVRSAKEARGLGPSASAQVLPQESCWEWPPHTRVVRASVWVVRMSV